MKLYVFWLQLVEAAETNTIIGIEEQALLLLIKGSILRHLGAHYQALECLESVIGYDWLKFTNIFDVKPECMYIYEKLHFRFKKQIKEDLHLVPYAIVEIGLLFNAMGDKSKAIATLEDAKSVL